MKISTIRISRSSWSG